MDQHRITNNNGLAINMEQGSTGGRHRATSTYGRNMTNAEKIHYYSLDPRDALAHDLLDMRNIYKDAGLYEEMLPNLIDYSRQYQTYLPDLFGKEG